MINLKVIDAALTEQGCRVAHDNMSYILEQLLSKAHAKEITAAVELERLRLVSEVAPKAKPVELLADLQVIVNFD